MDTKRYIHFSKDEKVLPYCRAQLEERRYFKPCGLWISDEEDYGWSKWCKDENFHLAQHQYEVYLKPEASVRYLTTPEDIDNFHREFSKNIMDWRSSLVDDEKCWYVDWQVVTLKLDGVVISPYQWERRHEYLWYYGWDCASGCIWNPRAIKSIKRIS